MPNAARVGWRCLAHARGVLRAARGKALLGNNGEADNAAGRREPQHVLLPLSEYRRYGHAFLRGQRANEAG